jgi:hypothetical protein
MRLGRWCNLCHPFEIIYLLKKADLSMWALKSRGMSVVCTWGLRGIFFLTLVLFVLFSHGAVHCFVAALFPTYVPYNSPLSYVCTVQFSNTPKFMFKYPECVLLTICRLTTWRRPTSSLLQPHPISPLPPPLNSLPCSNSHHHHVKKCPPLRGAAPCCRR